MLHNSSFGRIANFFSSSSVALLASLAFFFWFSFVIVAIVVIDVSVVVVVIRFALSAHRFQSIPFHLLQFVMLLMSLVYFSIKIKMYIANMRQEMVKGERTK